MLPNFRKHSGQDGLPMTALINSTVFTKTAAVIESIKFSEDSMK